MKLVVDSVLPLFALIGAGYLCGWRRVLGGDATNSLNLFVVWLALPALLFQAVAQTRWSDVNHAGFVLSIGFAMLATFALWVVVALVRSRGRASTGGDALADASIEALAAAYPNTGFMGIPLCLAVFGHAGLNPAIIATLMTACLLFGISLALIEIGLHHGHGVGRALIKSALTLARNPLLAAPALGLVAAVAHLPLPAPLLRFTGLLGAAASPCALVTIGLFLAQNRGDATAAAAAAKTAVGGGSRTILPILVLKMILQPLIAGVLVFRVFDLPRPWSSAAVLLTALPIGTGPFMLAKLYDRRAAVTSRAILLSTLLSLLTISALVAWIGRAGP
jgi:malonate transporter and related proteins